MNKTRKHYKSNSVTKLVEACLDCILHCEVCATTEAKECANICRDCADICNLCLRFEARESEFKSLIYKACATISNKCAEICSKYDTEHCIECAKCCKLCAKLCMQNL